MRRLKRSAPADMAFALTGRDYLSFSAVRTYQSCPLRYYFRYVQGLPETTVSASLVFGSAIHAAIEAHYREQLRGNRTPGLEVLQRAYGAAWKEFGTKQIQFVKEENQASLGRLADRVLNAFRGSDLAGIAARGKILAIEEEFRGTLIPGCPEILARVDLLVDTGRDLLVTDFKTARSPWGQEQVADAAGQLLLYHDLVRPLADGRPVRLEFAVITKTQAPVLIRHGIPADCRQIDRTKQIVTRVWEAIQSGLFYPSPSPMNCGGCPFRKPCQEWNG